MPESSKRSYAQVVKDVPPPPSFPCRTEFTIEIVHVSPEQCDDWTDVSSVTSCDWPASTVESDSISPEHRTPADIDHAHHGQRHQPDLEPIDSVPWVDDADTRVSHAMAGHIKHANRSRWRYSNIPIPPGHPMVEETVKLWLRYPGLRPLFDACHRHDTRKESKTEFQREMKEAAVECRDCTGSRGLEETQGS